MAAVKLRIAALLAFAVGIALGIARTRKTRFGVVAPDGTTVRPRRRIDVHGLPGKVRAVAVLSIVRARDAVGVRLGWRDGEEATDAIVVEMAEDLAAAINSRRSLAG